MKKIKGIKGIISTALCIVLLSSSMGFAIENPDDMYVERHFVYFNYNNTNDNSLRRVDKRSTVNAEDSHEFSNMMENSKNLSRFLNELLEKGEKIIGIGSATAYFNESIDKEISIQPMTVREMVMPFASGGKEKKGNLTVYTVASLGDGGLHAYTYAEWSSGISSTGKTKRAIGEDKITISAQKAGLTIVDGGFSANTVGGGSLPSSRYNLEDLKYTSMIYSFEEYDGNGNGNDVSFAVIGATYNGKVSTGFPYNCVSSYVHTWEDIDVSFSISATGCSANLSGVSAAWKLSSYLTITQGV